MSVKLRFNGLLTQSELLELDNAFKNPDIPENLDRFVELMDLVVDRYLERHPTIEAIKADIERSLSHITKNDFEEYQKKLNSLYKELKASNPRNAAELLEYTQGMTFESALNIVTNHDNWSIEPNIYTCINFLNTHIDIELEALEKLTSGEEKVLVNSYMVTDLVIAKVKEFYPEFYKVDETEDENENENEDEPNNDDDGSLQLNSLIHTKMSYPDKNKKMLWILGQTIESRLKDCLSEGDGKPIELDAKQHKLVVSLYNMISNPEPGMEDNIFTLDYIIKYYYGKNGKDEKPTKEEREEFYTMLNYFHTTPIVTPITDENGETKLLHTYIVDLDYTEGFVNGTRCAELFHIKSVIDLETIGNFSYYQAGLPPRMAHSIENIRIQQAVFDTRFSPDNNKEIDFEKLCKSLKIRQNSQRRYDVIEKIRKMIQFYGMGREVVPIEKDNGKVGHNRIIALAIQ